MHNQGTISSHAGSHKPHRGLKIIIAGGGTGGHIFPAIAIANALRKKDPRTEVLFIGAKGKMEMEKVPQAGYDIVGLDIAGFNRSSMLKNLGLPFKLIRSFLQVRSQFISFMPDAVIGVGGYSSFPVLRYAQAKGIPSFIHEANSFAGKSNMLLGKKATSIFVATDGMEKFFPAGKIIISGNPVREAIVNSTTDRNAALAFFQLDPAKKTVLSIGGSLGAKTINEALDNGLERFAAEDIQLIWQTGKPYSEKAKQRAASFENVRTNDFITNMDHAYAAADVVISRSGAMSVAELAVAGKAVVFVPYPYAAEDHQTVNAKKLVDKMAALMIPDSAAKEQLVDMVIKVVKNDLLQKELKSAIAKLAIRNADEVIAEKVLRVTRELTGTV